MAKTAVRHGVEKDLTTVLANHGSTLTSVADLYTDPVDGATSVLTRSVSMSGAV